MKFFRDQFKNKIVFVKPLYKNVKSSTRNNAKKTFVTSFDKNINLDGNEIFIRSKHFGEKSYVKTINFIGQTKSDHDVPGVCDNINNKYIVKTDKNNSGKCRIVEMIKDDVDTSRRSTVKSGEKVGKLVGKLQAEKETRIDKTVNVQLLPETWLRVYPAPKRPGESVCSVIFRYMISQLGLTTFLVLWTYLAVIIIHHFEGPHEDEVSIEFEKEQNQLVIDLATELRQVSEIIPMSGKWRNIIQVRIKDGRQQTIEAVSNGARVDSGRFWSLPGTFLFTIYVMTCLGFGAPVPHTEWGRTVTIIYALLSVPTHVILMWNASTCVIFHVDEFIKRYATWCRTDDADTNSANYGRNLEINKSNNKSKCKRKLLLLCSIVFYYRGLPAICLVYYVCGAASFGIARKEAAADVLMFPLDFTTTGCLAHIDGYVRVLYALYVEGAMCLLSCVLATFRKSSSGLVTYIEDRYRLMATGHTID